MQMKHRMYKEACSVNCTYMPNFLYFPTSPCLEPTLGPLKLPLDVVLGASLTPLSWLYFPSAAGVARMKPCLHLYILSPALFQPLWVQGPEFSNKSPKSKFKAIYNPVRIVEICAILKSLKRWTPLYSHLIHLYGSYKNQVDRSK